MEKEEFLRVNREHFKQLGFNVVTKNKFCYNTDEFVLEVCLTHSNYGKRYYVDYYISIKALHPTVCFSDCKLYTDAHGRFEVTLEYEKIALNQYIRILSRQIRRHIKPIMEKGVKVIPHLPNIFIYKKDALEFFENIYK